MLKRTFFLALSAALLLSSCGTLNVSVQQDATATLPATLPAMDSTKTTLEIEATSMSAFVTQQAATLYPATPPPTAAFDPLSPWKSYQDPADNFSFEYPIVYDMEPYGQSCGLRVYKDSLQLGQQIEILLLPSNGLSLEAYTDQVLAEKDWRIERREVQTINGLKAITVDYRFGGTDRFGNLTLVERNGLIYAFQFTAGGFCEIPGPLPSEPEVYDHLVQSFHAPAVPGPALTDSPPSQVNPILIFPPYGSRSGFLLGGSKDGQWLDSTETASLLTGDESYALYAMDGLHAYSLGSLPAQTTPFCPSMQEVALHADDPLSSMVGLGSDWNALPRRPEELSTDNEIYRQAVLELLQANGIAQPDVELTRLLQIDLEGDGVDEILISAERFADPSGHAVADGDYSVVLLRKVDGNSVLSLPLVADTYHAGNDSAYPNKYLLTGVLDLNNDGRMEIVVTITGWEKTGAIVYEVAANEARQVLAVRCPER